MLPHTCKGILSMLILIYILYCLWMIHLLWKKNNKFLTALLFPVTPV